MTRHAFVTGASSGLGKALATRLAAEGWSVSLAARRVELLEEVRAEIETAGGRAQVCPCDVADRAAVAEAVALGESRLGPVDLLVANAGVDIPMPAEAVDVEVLERVLRVNVLGATHAAEAVLPGMLERGRGHLVAIGSLAGYGGLPHGAAYTAAKGALHNLFESFRIDLRGTGVDVTVVTPGNVRTPMVEGLPASDLPLILEVGDAAERVMRGIRERRRLVSFPFALSFPTWLGQALPRGLHDRIAARFAHSGREPVAPGAEASLPSTGAGVAFITGASSGLGRGLAERLAARGWAVALAARRVDRLEEVAEGIRTRGGRCAICPCDVTDRASVHDAVTVAEEALGPVDLLVANAGVSEAMWAQDLDSALVARVLDINVLGMARAVERVLPGMIRRGRGHLVAIGSLAGYGGLPQTGPYSASKAAVQNFFESLRIDLRRSGVAVTMITPGYVKTELTAKSLHPMPYLMELDDAVDLMDRAIVRRRPHLTFPRPLSTLVWWAQLLPGRLYDAMASRVRRDKSAD